ADLLGDPALAEWKDGLPVSWQVMEGAVSGPGKSGTESEIARGPEGGVLLRGDAGTGRWRLLRRPFEAKGGTVYRLSFEFRAAGLRLEAGQFDNCWAGIRLPSGGEEPFLSWHSLSEGGWRPAEVLARAGADGPGEVRLFLSRTGTLEVRGIRLEPLEAADSYDALVRYMGLHYSHFASKGIDWGKEAEARAGPARAAKDPEAFVKEVLPLLARLEDVHVTIRAPGGPVLPTHIRRISPNIDVASLRKRLSPGVTLGKAGIAGVAGRDLGYLLVGLLPDPAAAAPLQEALEGMLDRRGILLDLRACPGGNETTAAALARAFVKEPVLYARSRFRDGPAPGDFGPAFDRVLTPREGRRFEGPVVVLIGPACVSSGEGFAQMMAAIPGAVLLGQPTAGQSGNPRPLELPNGVVVSFSRWISLLPDGTPIEGKGVPPDILVEHAGGGDPTFEKGLEVLER
ncbi:MAG: S41 family peptidase, partial [Planctomycetaceae bacterium]|nr:S41 family peptidase [Planctomycetaceae bacterium]